MMTKQETKAAAAQDLVNNLAVALEKVDTAIMEAEYALDDLTDVDNLCLTWKREKPDFDELRDMASLVSAVYEETFTKDLL